MEPTVAVVTALRTVAVAVTVEQPPPRSDHDRQCPVGRIRSRGGGRRGSRRSFQAVTLS